MRAESNPSAGRSSKVAPSAYDGPTRCDRRTSLPGVGMDRHQLDVALPIAYAIALAICSLWIRAAITPVAIVGALLLGLYYAVLRKKRIEPREGRPRLDKD